jgi:hypothetical protein
MEPLHFSHSATKQKTERLHSSYSATKQKTERLGSSLPNTGRSGSVPESGMEPLRPTWLWNQTLPKACLSNCRWLGEFGEGNKSKGPKPDQFHWETPTDELSRPARSLVQLSVPTALTSLRQRPNWIQQRALEVAVRMNRAVPALARHWTDHRHRSAGPAALSHVGAQGRGSVGRR